MNGSFMLGGGRLKMGDLTDVHPFKILLAVILFITLKVLVVQYSYNSAAPVFIKNFGGDLTDCTTTGYDLERLRELAFSHHVK